MTRRRHEAYSESRNFQLLMRRGVCAVLFAVLGTVSSSADNTNSENAAAPLPVNTAVAEPGIPYPEGPSFVTPPTWSGTTNAAVLSSLPPELMPLGAKKPTALALKPSIPTGPIAILPAPAPSTSSPTVSPPSTSNTNAENPEIVMRRDFYEWIQENQRSAEKAQKIAEKYKELSGKSTNDLSFEMIVKLRFPYIGTESPPPGSGSVIYTTPKN